MKAVVGAFNQEKALVGAFSVIVQPVVEPMDHFTALEDFHANVTMADNAGAALHDFSHSAPHYHHFYQTFTFNSSSVNFSSE